MDARTLLLTADTETVYAIDHLDLTADGLDGYRGAALSSIQDLARKLARIAIWFRATGTPKKTARSKVAADGTARTISSIAETARCG
jgi:hypothetical protein